MGKEMNINQKKNLMGKLVVVNKIIGDREFTSGSTRTWEITPIEPRTGWVVGFRNKHNGIIEEEWGGYDSYGEEVYYYPRCLVVKETIPCMLVSFYPNKAPVYVPLTEDNIFRLATENDPYPTWKEAAWPEDVKDDIKNWPRHKDGKYMSTSDWINLNRKSQ
jgi:hypothetical protein